MPIKGLVAGRAFTPEDVASITCAYNFVVAKLDLQTTDSKENAGKLLVRLAGESQVIDAEELTQDALRKLQAEGS